MSGDTLTIAIEKRVNLTERLIASLEHVTHAQAVAIVSSWIGLDQLEGIVKFQEGRN